VVSTLFFCRDILTQQGRRNVFLWTDEKRGENWESEIATKEKEVDFGENRKNENLDSVFLY